MDIMENLSLEFYQTGSPRPSDIETKIFNEQTRIYLMAKRA